MESFACPRCNQASTYPLKPGWRVYWWVLAIMTAVGGAALNFTLHDGYSWIPSGVGLVSFTVLCADVVVRHRIDRKVREVTRAASRASDEQPPTAVTREVEVPPGYVAVLTIVITLSVVSSVIGALLVTGLNNARSHEVIVSELTSLSAYSATTIDLVQSSRQICRDGDDYTQCLNMHIAMYNSVCVTSDASPFSTPATLSSTARLTCNSLGGLIEDMQVERANCGYGCTVRVGADGRWGFAYLRPSLVATKVHVPRVTYEERCDFDLGPIKLGYCPT